MGRTGRICIFKPFKMSNLKINKKKLRNLKMKLDDINLNFQRYIKAESICTANSQYNFLLL